MKNPHTFLPPYVAPRSASAYVEYHCTGNSFIQHSTAQHKHARANVEHVPHIYIWVKCQSVTAHRDSTASNIFTRSLRQLYKSLDLWLPHIRSARPGKRPIRHIGCVCVCVCDSEEKTILPNTHQSPPAFARPFTQDARRRTL